MLVVETPDIMNLRAVLGVLKEFGVTEYSNGKISVKMELQLPERLIKTPDQLTETQQQEIIKKIEDMKSLMHLDDDRLMDRIFPAEMAEGIPEEGLSGV